MVQQRPVSHTPMAKLASQKVVPVAPDSKANHVVRWLYHVVFPEITVHENEKDSVHFNPSTILGKAVSTHPDLLLRETGDRRGIEMGAIHTFRPRLRWPRDCLMYRREGGEEVDADDPKANDTSEHDSLLSTSGRRKHSMMQTFLLPNGATDWIAYLGWTNANLSFTERINYNVLIRNTVASYADANLTSDTLAMKHDMVVVHIIFRSLPVIASGGDVERAAHMLSYDCVRNQFVLVFSPDVPETLEQLGTEWHRAEEVLRMSVESFVHILHGRGGFADECPLWDAEYGFQLCVLIEIGVFITDFLPGFDQRQYRNVNGGEFWMIRPILKEWRKKLVDFARFPNVVFHEAGEFNIGKHTCPRVTSTTSTSAGIPIMFKGSKPPADSDQTLAVSDSDSRLPSEYPNRLHNIEQPKSCIKQRRHMKRPKNIFEKTPCGKTKLLDDYEGAAHIGVTLRIKNMGPLKMRQCLRPRRTGVQRSPPYSTRVPPKHRDTLPNPKLATASRGSTNKSQDHAEFYSDEDSLRLLEDAHKNLNLNTPCLSPLPSLQDGTSVLHELELLLTKTDIDSPLPSQDLPPVDVTNGALIMAEIWKVVSGLEIHTPYPSPRRMPRDRTPKDQFLEANPPKDENVAYFHGFDDHFTSNSWLEKEYMSQKFQGTNEASDKKNDDIDMNPSIFKTSQPRAKQIARPIPAAWVPEPRLAMTSFPPSVRDYIRRLSKPKPKAPSAYVAAVGISSHPSVSDDFHHLSKFESKASAACNAAVDSPCSSQPQSLTQLCASCEYTADLQLLVNTRKNSLLGERYIIACFNIYSDYFDRLAPEKSWRRRSQLYNWILDNIDRREGGHADWEGHVEVLRDRGADVDAIDAADARVSDDLLDEESNPQATSDGMGQRNKKKTKKSVDFVNGPHPTRFVTSARDGGVR